MSPAADDTTGQRERILSAALDAIAEHGLSRLRMEDIGARAGMSPGHILYYYRSKQALLLETLRWSEQRLAEARREELRRPPDASGRLRRFVELYLPEGPDQANWLLWLQAWALGIEGGEVRSVAAQMNALWVDDLVRIVRAGVRRGEFKSVEATGFAAEYIAVLDGLSVHVLSDTPALDRDRAITVALDVAAVRLGASALV